MEKASLCLLAAAWVIAIDATGNVPCSPMTDYLPHHIPRTYNMSKHNGTWYEVSFRDLYPWGPVCFCQQSIKYVHEAEGYIDDWFVFTCGLGAGKLGPSYMSPQRENVTDGATGKRHPNGLYDMYVHNSAFKFITHYEWNSEVVGFKDDGQEQYAWVIEFQCGTRPALPKFVCPFGRAPDGQCYFTGIQMYVRDLQNVETGRDEMVRYVQSLGPETSNSLAIDWVTASCYLKYQITAGWQVMTDFSKGTFPPWYKNVSYADSCPFPCKAGCFNEETQTWGCCTNNTEVAVPAGFEFRQ